MQFESLKALMSVVTICALALSAKTKARSGPTTFMLLTNSMTHVVQR